MLLDVILLHLQFLHLVICLVPCICSNLGSSFEFSRQEFIACLKKSSSVAVHAFFLLSPCCYCEVLLYFQWLFSVKSQSMSVSSLRNFWLPFIAFVFFSTSVVCKPCLVKIQGISLSLSKQSFSVVPQTSSLLAHSGCCFSSNAESYREFSIKRTCWCYELSIPDRPTKLVMDVCM